MSKDRPLSDARKALYQKLSDLVDEFSKLDVTEDDDPQLLPTGWALLIGYEGIADDHLDRSTVGVYPKDGSQPAWKTAGILHQGISYYNKGGSVES